MKRILIVLVLLITQISFAQKTGIKPNIKRLRNDTIVWHADSFIKQR